MDQFFKSLKVIDLSSVLAGPSVAMFFAELGAEVIKIENPKTGGDVTRHWKLAKEASDKADSAYFASINYGKEIINLDLTLAQHLSKLHSLIASADILITNYKDSSLTKFKLDYENLTKLNPLLIFAQLTSYNKEGKAAYDVIMQAETGYLSMTGTQDSYTKMPVALIDVIAAHQLKEAILIGIIRKLKERKGSFFKVSLYDSAVTSLVNQASNYLNVGHLPKRMGTQHPNIAPYGDLFESADKVKFVLAIVNDHQFSALANLLNLASEKIQAYETNQARLEKRNELVELLQQSFATFKIEDLELAFVKHKIPFGRLYTIDEVLNNEDNKELILAPSKALNYQVVKSIAFKLIK